MPQVKTKETTITFKLTHKEKAHLIEYCRLNNTRMTTALIYCIKQLQLKKVDRCYRSKK